MLIFGYTVSMIFRHRHTSLLIGLVIVLAGTLCYASGTMSAVSTGHEAGNHQHESVACCSATTATTDGISHHQLLHQASPVPQVFTPAAVQFFKIISLLVIALSALHRASLYSYWHRLRQHWGSDQLFRYFTRLFATGILNPKTF